MQKAVVVSSILIVGIGLYLSYNPLQFDVIKLSSLPQLQSTEFWKQVIQQFRSNTSQQSFLACELSGTEQRCRYADVDKLNLEVVHGVLTQLVKTAFFRYFKVNLWCDCPLWPDDGMCSLQACSVCECEEGEIPKAWKIEEGLMEASNDFSKCAQTIQAEQAVNRTVASNLRSKLVTLKGWRGFNNPWMWEEENEEEYLYINLLDNPERYTGYKGEHAHRIWSSIYSQSCFDDLKDGGEVCMEKKIFYRIISGMHASISAHIAKEYLLDEIQGVWGENLDLFAERFAAPERKEYVENLYFAYLFVLRAVQRAAPSMLEFPYVTGIDAEDQRTVQLVKQLLTNKRLESSCPVPFDEGRLWKGADGVQLKKQLQNSFKNITRIMDCVGCEKCKLWGKLQVLGISTALKILFSADDCKGHTPVDSFQDLTLERNELIALINLLDRLSQSVELYRRMSLLLKEREGFQRVVDQNVVVQ
eukprot:TRINITY_DN5970_c0_g2_i1.p1 TRINITY_DN5970_c0_g2~~TRINITY_DN5970_c0_g2_i1.p1  ORF type:complete len:492 (+),score=46.91 TRINITY_DN5970_c0_g2_i1:55-1476(+)